MRRKDKEVKEVERISEIIGKCQICRLAMSYQDFPYIVPVCFGWDGEKIYFHTAQSGKKIEILSKNKRVCFEFESGVKLMPHPEKPCKWSFSYQSVVGVGEVEELLKHSEKVVGLQIVMSQYSNSGWDLEKVPLHGVRVWSIIIESLSGKQSLDYVSG